MIRFIVGTDTAVGKSYYGQVLARGGDKVIKPIETGKKSFQELNMSDCHQYATIQSLAVKEINCYFFSEPVSPHFASEIDGEPIDIEKLKSFITNDKDSVVELAGGLLVPLKDKYTQLDLIKETTNASVILVIGNKLGCINHALMTLEILAHADIKIAEVVINNLGVNPTPLMENNIKTISRWLALNTPLKIIS